MISTVIVDGQGYHNNVAQVHKCAYCQVTNTKENLKTEWIHGIRVLRNLFFPPQNVLFSYLWIDCSLFFMDEVDKISEWHKYIPIENRGIPTNGEYKLIILHLDTRPNSITIFFNMCDLLNWNWCKVGNGKSTKKSFSSIMIVMVILHIEMYMKDHFLRWWDHLDKLFEVFPWLHYYPLQIE